MRSVIIPKWVKEHLSLNENYWQISEEAKIRVRDGLRQYVSNDGVKASIVIPAWNEENSIFSTLSSLSEQKLSFDCELIVINNNSTDRTQEVLDDLGVKSVLEEKQGIGYARQSGLENAKGKYFLCADADCIYPKTWAEEMVKTIEKNELNGAQAVYSDYSFITTSSPRWFMAIYESSRTIVYYFKLRKKVHLLVRGFSFGIIREAGLKNGAFLMGKQRKGKGIPGSEDFAIGGEDGNMAYTIINDGGLVLPASGSLARVWTSDRRLIYDGGIAKAIKVRIRKYFYKNIKK